LLLLPAVLLKLLLLLQDPERRLAGSRVYRLAVTAGHGQSEPPGWLGRRARLAAGRPLGLAGRRLAGRRLADCWSSPPACAALAALLRLVRPAVMVAGRGHCGWSCVIVAGCGWSGFGRGRLRLVAASVRLVRSVSLAVPVPVRPAAATVAGRSHR
jgi:hypothetical protein